VTSASVLKAGRSFLVGGSKTDGNLLCKRCLVCYAPSLLIRVVLTNLRRLFFLRASSMLPCQSDLHSSPLEILHCYRYLTKTNLSSTYRCIRGQDNQTKKNSTTRPLAKSRWFLRHLRQVYFSANSGRTSVLIARVSVLSQVMARKPLKKLSGVDIESLTWRNFHTYQERGTGTGGHI